MKFDEARFKKLLSEPGLYSLLKSPKNIILYQGATDTVAIGTDILKIRNGDIKEASLLSENPKISFLELERVMTVSEKIKAAGFPPLEISFKEHSVTARLVTDVPLIRKSDALVGLPASAGKVTAPCLVNPSSESAMGKIIVLKNSKDLHRYMKDKPAGIILEEGNLLSHASILAREAGIPAIVKVENATQKIKSGTMISIDGSVGSITIPTLR